MNYISVTVPSDQEDYPDPRDYFDPKEAEDMNSTSEKSETQPLMEESLG